MLVLVLVEILLVVEPVEVLKWVVLMAQVLEPTVLSVEVVPISL